MRLIRTLSLLTLCLSGLAAHAGSIDPDLNRLLREAQKPKMHYWPARAGWNGPETPEAQRVPNPVYESLRMDSPAALRRELKAVLVPDWQMLAAFAILVIGLRMLRSSQEATRGEVTAGVASFPAQVPQQEAA